MTETRIEHQRFARRIEHNGTWTVFDVATGVPAEVGSRQATGMQMDDAIEMVELLNRVHPRGELCTPA